MTRSPLAYPLNRSADTDVGGAADLQTDIMRFMAILALCLVAIFALVQSIPLTPVAPQEPVAAETVPVDPVVHEEPVEAETVVPVVEQARPSQAAPAETVTLTRPKWVPRFQPSDPVITETTAEPVPVATKAEPVPVEKTAAPAAIETPVEPSPPAETQGFTLRFESDAALMRAVAASHVGLYAIENNKAQRMTVSNSRISFWSASTPNAFHEMEAATVPRAVVDALARTGSDTDDVNWGVTLPGKMKTRLEALMQAHSGGSLIIGAGGDIRWEAT